jgi:hypothetical protein
VEVAIAGAGPNSLSGVPVRGDKPTD